MTIRPLLAAALATTAIALAAAQAPAVVDTAKLGPLVGATAPSFSGVDQFGKSHTLTSAMGPKGAMLVFCRSADW